MYFLSWNLNWSFYWLPSDVVYVELTVERRVLYLSVSSLKIGSLFFSYLKTLWPSREKKKDDSEIVRSWKDAQVLTIRVAASFPNLEGHREEQRHGHRVSFCVVDGEHEGCLSLCLKTLYDPEKLWWCAISGADNRQRYKQVEGNESAKELSQIIGKRQSGESAGKIKDGMGKIM